MTSFLLISFLLLPDSTLLRTASQSLPSTDPWSVKQLVEYHQRLRSNLQVQDVYKMLYLSYFGVEHLLADTSEARTRLMSELETLDTTEVAEPLVERISTRGDMVRINLRPFKALNLNPASLVQFMLVSAEKAVPDTLMFNRDWNEFCSLVRYGMLIFPEQDVNEWSARVSSEGIRPVHHSSGYSQTHRPAYRVGRYEFVGQTLRLEEAQ